MSKRRKKGSSITLKAEDRHWYAKREAAKAEVKRAAGRQETSAGRWAGGRDQALGSAGRNAGPMSRGPGPAGREADEVRPGARGQGGRTAGRREGPELVTGRNAVVEALRAKVPATALYVMSGVTDERIREAIQLAADHRVPLLEAGRGELDRMTDRAVHQGVALQVPEYGYSHPDDLLERPAPQLIVALDGVTDPRNLGAVVRSAAAFGATGVLVPERRSAGVTAGAWKASAGALASVPVARATNLVRALKAYQDAGLTVVGLDAGGSGAIEKLPDAADPIVLVVGSEGKGLSRLVAETCDLLVTIPMAPAAESLNAGVAAGIALYEIARKRRA
jgi:23S rRNA (guanosine2251-2'-O)-methyltransferase